MLENKHFIEVRECDLCKGISFKLILTDKNGFKVMKCNYCGLCFTSPRLSYDDSTVEYAKNHDIMITSKAYMDEYLIPVENQKERVIEKLAINSGSYVLDIGCGVGDFLIRMAEKGFKVRGIDSLKSAVDIATKKGLNVIHGDINEVLDKNGFLNNTKFDLITLWASLEHFYSPSSVLLKLNKILKDNGLLVIAVPNFNSIQSWLFKEDWFHLEMPNHLYHFTSDSLSQLCNKTGFKVIDCFPALPVHAYGCLRISCITKIKRYKGTNFLKYLFFRSMITIAPLFIFIENILRKMEFMCLIAKKSEE